MLNVSSDKSTKELLVRSLNQSRLLADIERLRKELTDEYSKPTCEREDEMVLELSRKLDELILKYYRD